jgi:hypothetical protein
MADPYVTDPYGAATAGLKIALPDDYGDAGAYEPILSKYRTAFSAREQQREGIEAKQQLNADQMSALLNGAAAKIRQNREGRSNLPMIAMGAGMMGPGDFGTQVGRGLQAMVPAIEKQRAEEDATELQVANLGVKAGEVQNMPLKEKLDYLKALQTGDMATIRAIETAQIRAQAQQAKMAGTLTANQKEFEQARREDPELAGWTLNKWLQWKEEIRGRDPAELKVARQLMKDDPKLSVTDALMKGATLESEAKAKGKTRAEAAAALPGVQVNADMIRDTINQLKDMPLESIVGKPWSSLVGLPSTDKAKFEALESAIKGQAFTQAFESLRGGGAITEVEGLKATQSRFLSARNLRPEDYRQFLDEFNYWTQRGLRTVQEKAGTPEKDLPPMPQKPPGMVAREQRNNDTGTPVPPNQGSPSPPTQTGPKSGSIDLGAPAVTPQGQRLPEGQTATDKATGKRIIVKQGVWTEM